MPGRIKSAVEEKPAGSGADEGGRAPQAGGEGEGERKRGRGSFE